MSHERESGQAGTRTVIVDLVVAAIIFVLGALVAFDSYRLGASWGADGPQSGYFPFYIGLLLGISSAVVGVQSLLRLPSDRKIFIQRDPLKQVLVLLVPTAVYVLGVQVIGIYVPSAVFIGLFMKIIGQYSWRRSAAVGAAVSVVSFVLFEIWFKIPLPKGPVESLLGY